ncbi:MAG: hypothetical protein ACRDHZ_07405 [Ktedonobacteraceae bacterium]
MGQYQQWLHAQEMDRRLKAEVELLEAEILYLKDRITVLEQTLPDTENVILHALLAYQRDHANREQQAHERAKQPSQSDLPNRETPRPPVMETTPYYFGLRSEQGLLPGSMLAFFEKRAQTNPDQWQRHRTAGNNEVMRSIDEETRLQNENVQRWFERWHREADSTAQPEGRRNEQ